MKQLLLFLVAYEGNAGGGTPTKTQQRGSGNKSLRLSMDGKAH